MSTTQHRMLPDDAANYDAPRGGFSADPKVPRGSPEIILSSACSTSSRGGANRTTNGCPAACNQ